MRTFSHMASREPELRYERVAIPVICLLLVLVLLVPVITTRRASVSYDRLNRVGAAQRALGDALAEISATIANTLTPIQDSASRRRLGASLARSDSAARRLAEAAVTLDPDARALMQRFLDQLEESKEGPRRQARGELASIRDTNTVSDPFRPLTRLLAVGDSAVAALQAKEAFATDRVRVVNRQGDVATVALGVATAGILFVLAWLSHSLRRLTHELRDRVASEHEARARADTAVAQRDQVLRIVSHDLKNPLHTIGMAMQIAADDSFPEPARRKQLDVITRSLDRMSRLVADLLDVARLESGRAIAIKPERLDLAPVMNEAVEQFDEVAKAKNVAMHLELPATHPPVLADRVRLLQVLSNLMGNAVKFTPPKGVVTVRAEADSKYTRIAVSNSGPPISAELLPRLFTPFSQAKDTAGLGTGLGLSIAKGIVEAHGGEIGVTSSPERQTTFSFTLPVVTTEAEARR